MNLNLKGCTALVSGATKGIGRAIALEFASEGCNVAVCARSESDVAAMVETLRGVGVGAFGMAVDVCNSDSVKNFVDSTASKFGGLDIVVSNVSAATGDWNKMFQTDLLGATRLFDSALPHFKKSSKASFTAISSRAAYTSGGAYSAIKCALMSYVKSLSWDYAPIGIRANTVSPGDIYFKDGFWDRVEQTMPNVWAEAQVRNRMGRLGRPEEVASAVVFLSSPAASFISGANLRVDGSGSPTTQF
jgi:3-oxoacyl-[acyl-carrier protein] reductase